MPSNNNINHDHHHQKSLPIKEDDNKFFTRIMSKETSIANSSSRIYFRGAHGSIPFNWETAPGTPKATINGDDDNNMNSYNNLPPLTPPPSYYNHSKTKSTQKHKKPVSLSSITNILPKLIMSKSHVSPSASMSSASSSSSSLSSWSSFRSTTPKVRKRRDFSSSRSPINFHVDDDVNGSIEDESVKSRGFRGCYLIGNVKNKFLSIVGHGPSR